MTHLISRSLKAVIISFVFIFVAGVVLVAGSFFTAQASNTFQIGARVITVASTTVRATPKGTVLGSQLVGALGTIVGGPYITGEGTDPWWQIDFDSGVDGWVKQSTISTSTGSAPMVSIIATPTSITSGQSSTLTWSSTNATSCTASDGWSGTKATSSSESVSPTATTTYTLACSGAGGTATSSATVNVVSSSPAPTVSFVADPTFLAAGQSSSLTWTSTDATSCSASGGWGGTKTATGTEVVIPTATTTYSLTCSGAGGSATSTLTIGVNVLGGSTNCVSGPSTPDVRLCSVTRSTSNPIVSSTTSSTIGTNISMPSVVHMPSWLPSPMGTYYMYFAGHNGSYIRMATATTSPIGPWTVYTPGSVKDTQVSPFYSTISSPDVFVQDATHTIRMYFSTDHYASNTSEQWSGVASSTDGINFSLESTQNIAKYYLRVFQWRGQFYGLQKGWNISPPEIGVSSDGVAAFNYIKNFPAMGSVRHMAVLLKGDILMIFYSKIGDAPERIMLSTINLAAGAPSTWEFSTPVEVLRPTTIDEGALYPVVPSLKGKENDVNELRDPYILEENGHTYLYYGIAGETGIAVAELTYDILIAPPAATISATPTSITSGQSSTLTWSSTNATSCTASDGWSGTKATSSSESVSPTATTTYTLACSGAGGTATSSATVNVVSSSPAPTVSFVASSTSITSGQSSTLTWSSTDTTSCTASDGWSGALGTAGSQTVSPTATTTYTLACSGAGGTATSSATVNVAHIFGVGARVITVASTTVRATPKGTVLGSQLVGALGTIVGGPYITGEGGNPWWQIDFDSGVDGWVKQSYLTVL